MVSWETTENYKMLVNLLSSPLIWSKEKSKITKDKFVPHKVWRIHAFITNISGLDEILSCSKF